MTDQIVDSGKRVHVGGISLGSIGQILPRTPDRRVENAEGTSAHERYQFTREQVQEFTYQLVRGLMFVDSVDLRRFWCAPCEAASSVPVLADNPEMMGLILRFERLNAAFQETAPGEVVATAEQRKDWFVKGLPSARILSDALMRKLGLATVSGELPPSDSEGVLPSGRPIKDRSSRSVVRKRRRSRAKDRTLKERKMQKMDHLSPEAQEPEKEAAPISTTVGGADVGTPMNELSLSRALNFDTILPRGIGNRLEHNPDIRFPGGFRDRFQHDLPRVELFTYRLITEAQNRGASVEDLILNPLKVATKWTTAKIHGDLVDALTRFAGITAGLQEVNVQLRPTDTLAPSATRVRWALGAMASHFVSFPASTIADLREIPSDAPLGYSRAGVNDVLLARARVMISAHPQRAIAPDESVHVAHHPAIKLEEESLPANAPTGALPSIGARIRAVLPDTKGWRKGKLGTPVRAHEMKDIVAFATRLAETLESRFGVSRQELSADPMLLLRRTDLPIGLDSDRDLCVCIIRFAHLDKKGTEHFFDPTSPTSINVAPKDRMRWIQRGDPERLKKEEKPKKQTGRPLNEEEIFDLLIHASKAEWAELEFHDGRCIDGAVQFRPDGNRQGKIINVDKEIAVDFELREIRDVKA